MTPRSLGPTTGGLATYVLLERVEAEGLRELLVAQETQLAAFAIDAAMDEEAAS